MLSSKGRGGGCRRSCHVEFSRTLVIMRQASQFLSVFDFDEKLDMVTALFAEKLDRLIWHLNPETKGKEYNPADFKAPDLSLMAKHSYGSAGSQDEDGTLKGGSPSSTAAQTTPTQTTTTGTGTPAQTTPAQTTSTTTGGTETTPTKTS